MRKGTVAVRGYKHSDPYGALQPPIYLTALFRMEGEALKSDRGFDLKYSREENPTLRPLEEVVANLEGGVDSLAFNSGMAALSTVFFSLLSADASVLTPMEAYGATLRLLNALEKYGVRMRKAYPDTETYIEALKAVKPNLAFFETITNPMLRVLDGPEIIKAAKDLGAVVVVDNTFATPVLTTPISYGADVVVHSATKYLAGHNDVVGGIAVVARGDLLEELWIWRAMLGGIMQPFEAFLTLRGLKTLFVRFEKQCKTAMAVAQFLEGHGKVAEVIYPGLSSHPHHATAKRLFGDKFGAVVSFRIKGGRDAVVRFFKSLRLITPGPSLGGVESIATYPVASAASPIPEDERKILGITEDLVRLSIGLEEAEDLIEDLDRALNS
ncbi:cystathionine gamma-synthase family protein [Pyrobaculum aerophilum]|uniref:Cystathionine gamma-synthase n=1 Tax=Pyrobaculum aerophilum TaxID=13773 RepID=A0A371QXT9_9CREN|nr:cystathionine gamma-synthase family protein [Pyrobaculum aerophilum]RFA95257.1 cystathionine gamma-synthase [Pyrobaculum aerophilum]RFA97775.1 cystathionine gamma-synthase [Pyrobaculum aerophilum]